MWKISQLGLAFLLAFIAASIIECENDHSANKLNIIDYDEFSKNNFEILSKNKQLILIIYSKEDPSRNQQINNVINDFKKSVDHLNQDDREVAINIMIQDERVAAKYDLHIFPQLLFFRSGRRVDFDGKTASLRLLEEWFEAHQQKATFELNDASFEHDTQATSGIVLCLNKLFKHLGCEI